MEHPSLVTNHNPRTISNADLGGKPGGNDNIEALPLKIDPRNAARAVNELGATFAQRHGHD
jgi:hypothetical protein